MNSITKLALGAAAARARVAATPADAQGSVGVGIGGGHGGCRYHPCGRYAAPVGVGVGVGPVSVGVGTYVAGRGYWDGHGWYAHRVWGHGGWRYR